MIKISGNGRQIILPTGKTITVNTNGGPAEIPNILSEVLAEYGLTLEDVRNGNKPEGYDKLVAVLANQRPLTDLNKVGALGTYHKLAGGEVYYGRMIDNAGVVHGNGTSGKAR